MLFKNIIGFAFAAACIPGALSCLMDPPDNGANGTFPITIKGSDEPADPATTGYVLSHFGLNVKNMTASIDFYTKLLGMRLLFTFRPTANFSISYLAHSHGGKNGTGYQTNDELNRNKNNMEGLLELISYTGAGAPDIQPSTKVSNTFSHVGIVVPDVSAAQARFDQFGWPILKRSGAPEQSKGDQPNAYGFGQVLPDTEEGPILKALKDIGLDVFMLVEDPDGNLVEIQPQELKQL